MSACIELRKPCSINSGWWFGTRVTLAKRPALRGDPNPNRRNQRRELLSSMTSMFPTEPDKGADSKPLGCLESPTRAENASPNHALPRLCMKYESLSLFVH